MNRLLSGALSALGLIAMASAANAQSVPAREYFLARLAEDRTPDQLSAADRTYYRALFNAIDAQQWGEVQSLLQQRSEGPLHGVALAEYYLAANSPRVELPQIESWLSRYRNLPQAAQLGRLGLTRGAETMPDLPIERSLQSQGSMPNRSRPRPVEDGTMPASVKDSILSAISNDDPDTARVLLDGVDSSLSPEARTEWRQRVAWSYFIENRDPQALVMARTAASGRGSWAAEADWTQGLAAWRLNDCTEAGEAFQRAGYRATNPELRTAAYYWASRAALRCRQPEVSREMLETASGNADTMYGMLASEQLGKDLPQAHSGADLSAQDWQRIGQIENVRIASALMEIDRDVLASRVLLHQARIGDPRDYDALSRLARELGLPQTQLSMAYNAPSGGRAHPSSYYPAPRWEPFNGWKVDPALAYAHTLQESAFRAGAVSPANAQGLMQITPITVRQHAPTLGLGGSIDIFDPRINLAFGQRNLEMLRDDPATQGSLPKIMAAYNAGLTPVRRWEYEVRDQDDPLLYMEAIPYWETREYVSIVTRNYWMYERQAQTAISPSRITLAQNRWPAFPAAASTASGRVYLSSGNN